MGVLIFFTMALFIFLAGVAILTITFYRWYKEAQEKKQLKVSSES